MRACKHRAIFTVKSHFTSALTSSGSANVHAIPRTSERRASVARGPDLWLRRLPPQLLASAQGPSACSSLFTALYCSNLLENPHLHRVRPLGVGFKIHINPCSPGCWVRWSAKQDGTTTGCRTSYIPYTLYPCFIPNADLHAVAGMQAKPCPWAMIAWTLTMRPTSCS